MARGEADAKRRRRSAVRPTISARRNKSCPTAILPTVRSIENSISGAGDDHVGPRRLKGPCANHLDSYIREEMQMRQRSFTSQGRQSRSMRWLPDTSLKLIFVPGTPWTCVCEISRPRSDLTSRSFYRLAAARRRTNLGAQRAEHHLTPSFSLDGQDDVVARRCANVTLVSYGSRPRHSEVPYDCRKSA
jgi:hypothetical protein